MREQRSRIATPAPYTVSDRVRLRDAARTTRTSGDPQPLGPRGQALWDEASPRLEALHRELLLDTCRLMDSLDRLDGLLAGKARRGEWLRLQEGDGGEMRVVVDDLLAERRQHVTTLRGLVAELSKALPKASGSGSRKPAAKGGGLADITARIAAARGGASSA